MIFEIIFLTLVQIQTNRIEELDQYEVAVEGSAELPADALASHFSSCVPQESQPFNGKISSELEDKIFQKKSVADLMDCDADDCAFNFLPTELNSLKILKTEDERKEFYKQAIQKRSQFKIGPDPSRSSSFIRSRDKAFEMCGPSKALDELLNNRPVRDLPMRISTVKYNKNMRPTTRLVQGTFWTPKPDQFCYAEALIFSDHYDIDLVTVWSLEGKTLKLQLRNRIDLLNSWLRRLNKEKFRKEAETIVTTQLQDALTCFQKKNEKKK